jgi:ribonuclease D
VLTERLVTDLAQHRPKDVDALRSAKGLSSVARQRADEVLAAIDASRDQPPPVTPRGTWRAPSTRAQRWAELLLAIAQLVAQQHGIALRLLATRSAAEEFARVVDEGGLAAAEGLEANQSWRRDVLGCVWSGWLRGDVVLAGDLESPLGVRLAGDNQP